MALLTAGLLGAIVFAAFSLLDGMCGNTPIQTVVSPDGRRQATLFERNCGATTGFSSQVSILDAGDQLSTDAGNVFIAQAGSNGPTASWGGPPVHLRWLDEETLVIRHDRWANILEAVRAYRGVRIVYDAGG